MPTKILAIDDSKTMRLAIKISFAAEDADVTAVSKGSEAVVRAKQMAADVVLVDAVLAGGEPSGYDVCQQLKGDGDTAKIPVLLLVSNQTGPDAAKLKSCGADGWIAKPFETQELIDKVGEVLAKAGKPMAVSQPAAAAAAPAATIAAPPAAAKPAATIVSTPPAAAPAPAPAASAKTTPRAPQPLGNPVTEAPRPVAAAPAASTSTATPLRITPPASHEAGEGGIPIAIPIPFTSADAPTPGILERLRRAQGATAGLDPRVAEALVALSREVLEAAVWEVVPELAEQILREEARKRASA